jgi:hypothetical protein
MMGIIITAIICTTVVLLAWIGRKPKQHTITSQPPSVTEKPRFGSGTRDDV